MVQGHKVYVHWKQVGAQLGVVDGYQPTGFPITEITSAVYKIEDEKISEYWIQIDRSGVQKQLESNKKNDNT